MTPTSISNPLRVLVFAADELTRAGLVAVISELPGFSAAGQATSGSLIDDIDVFAPDIVVWDISDALDRLSLLPEIPVPVVVLAPTEESAGIAWTNGAKGILPRRVGRDELAAALNAVASRLTVVDDRFTHEIASPAPPAPPKLAESLTPRELQVLNLVAEGLPNKSIASELAISEHTVKFHINAILGKMGASSRTQAAALATRIGLIRL